MGKPELLFCCFLSMVVVVVMVVSKGLLMIWLFLDQPVSEVPPTPFILCKACGLLQCFCSETKLNFRYPAEILGLNQSSLL